MTIERARELLGSEFKELSDEEVQKIIDDWYKLVNLVIDVVEKDEYKKIP